VWVHERKAGCLQIDVGVGFYALGTCHSSLLPLMFANNTFCGEHRKTWYIEALRDLYTQI
jgi:hypothetical protein